MAEIGQGQDDARAQDADANLDRAIDRQEQGDIAASDLPDWSENIARKNCRCVAGKGRGIGGEITQERRNESADRAPERKSDEKADPVLAKERGKNDNANRSDNGSDHSEEALRSEAPSTGWQTTRLWSPPTRVAQLKGEGDVEGETDGSPQPQAEKDRRRRGAQCFTSDATPQLVILGAAAVIANPHITASSPPSM